MIIYYKCNFKLGKGYYISSYDTVGKHQKIILEKDDIIRQNMSNSIAYAFMTQVGRSMYLASDEDGNLFVGVFGLIGGNYDKYVNAVFCDNNKDLMCKVFSYFCNHYSIANQMLLDSVMRNDEVEQGYLVNEEITLDLYNRFIEEENVCEYRGNLPNYLIAFVSKESYEEYRHMLSRIFSDYNIVCIGEVDDTIEKIELPKPDKNFYKICIGIGVAVLITLFIVLL